MRCFIGAACCLQEPTGLQQTIVGTAEVGHGRGKEEGKDSFGILGVALDRAA